MPRVCITVTGKNAQPYRFSLERKVVRLGRAADNDIVIEDPSVSSHHCEMRRVDGGYILEDLASTNGIKLDGDRMEIIDLENGQEVTVGDAALDFELTEEELDTLAKEDHKPRGRAQLPPAPADKSKSKSKGEDKGKDEDKIEKEDERPRKKKSRPAAAKPRPARPAVRPQPAPPAVPPPLASAQNQNGLLNFMITMAFLFLAIFAFYLGLSTKHRAETKSEKDPHGRSLWRDMFAPEEEKK